MPVLSSEYQEEDGGRDATNSRDAERHAMMMRKGRVLCRYHVMRRFIYVDTTAF